jgi:hypothetical protein
VSPNAAAERRRAALSSEQQAHNEMARLVRACDYVSPSAPTACYALRWASRAVLFETLDELEKSAALPLCAPPLE